MALWRVVIIGTTKYCMFCFFAAICLVGMVTIYMFLQETRGKSLDEIQRHFQNRKESNNIDKV